jgi:hypothetical protein
MHRYPDQTQITLEDFRRCGWKDAIVAQERDGYWGMWRALSAVASAAIQKRMFHEGKALWLLADACSLTLDPGSPNGPFVPFVITARVHTALPDAYTKWEVGLLADFAKEVDDVWLQARLADLAWTLSTPRKLEHALLAIDAYRQISLDPDNWLAGGRECWSRAIRLAQMLRNGAGDRLSAMEAALVSAFDGAEAGQGYFAIWLADLMLDRGLASDHSVAIAEKLEAIARIFDGSGDMQRARDYYDAAEKWYRQTDEVDRAIGMIVCVAEGWAKEAKMRQSSSDPSHMVAASFYENAIQVYRRIPRRERVTHDVDARLAQLHGELAEAGARSLEEMKSVSSPSIDISAVIERSRSAVQGKTPVDALAAFASIDNGANVEKMRAFAEKMLQEHPLQALFGSTHVSRDGRVVAKRPGMGLDGSESKDYKVAVWGGMVNHYEMGLGIVVQGCILPALEALHLEHRISEQDFIAIASRSPIVPEDRSQIFGKALYAGYNYDFMVAIHLLVPQIEHTVRWHLKNVEVKTTTLGIDGIENEIGLSSLMELPELTKIFGENLTFELKALFCDPLGVNLRNELAHGLWDDDACRSIPAVYAWWLTTRIVFLPFWNALRTANKAGGGT